MIETILISVLCLILTAIIVSSIYLIKEIKAYRKRKQYIALITRKMTILKELQRDVPLNNVFKENFGREVQK
jgi:alpha-N-acetylglucosamine transferase